MTEVFYPTNPDPNWKPGDRRIRMTITKFLLARIAEDEHHARSASGWQTGSRHQGQPLDWSIHMDRWSPDRVLAECAAKRAIVDWHSAMENDLHEGSLDRNHILLCSECTDVDPYSNQVAYPCRTLRALALSYADQPDYDEAWRP